MRVKPCLFTSYMNGNNAYSPNQQKLMNSKPISRILQVFQGILQQDFLPKKTAPPGTVIHE